jgi:hypothetical protein
VYISMVSVPGSGGDSVRRWVWWNGVARVSSDRSVKVELRHFNPGQWRIR